jgi:hypothetical protein
MKDNEMQGSGPGEHLTSSPGKNRHQSSSRNSSMSSMDDIINASKKNELKMSSSIRRYYLFSLV